MLSQAGPSCGLRPGDISFLSPGRRWREVHVDRYRRIVRSTASGSARKSSMFATPARVVRISLMLPSVDCASALPGWMTRLTPYMKTLFDYGYA